MAKVYQFLKSVSILESQQVETKSKFTRHIFKLECLRKCADGPDDSLLVETFNAEINFEAGVTVKIDTQSRQHVKELLGVLALDEN